MTWAFAGNTQQSSKVLLSAVTNGMLPEFIIVESDVPKENNIEFYKISEEYEVPIYSVLHISECKKFLKKIDLLFVFRFSLISEEIYSLPSLGSVNMHFSLLPKYPGVHPVSWAIINGEDKTGVTIHKVDSGIDSGDILLQKSVEIYDSDDIFTLTNKLENIGSLLINDFIRGVQKEHCLPIGFKQDLKSGFYARRRTPDDGKINFDLSSDEIYNLTRSLKSPLPESFLYTSTGEKLYVKSSKKYTRTGEVIAKLDATNYLVKIKDGVLAMEIEATLSIGDILC